jgi:hypothetical protein
MISKTAPESAFMVLCLPEQSRKKDDWKWVLGIAIEAEVYNKRASCEGVNPWDLSPWSHSLSLGKLSTNHWESVNISVTAYPNLSMINSGKWHVKNIYKLQNTSWKIK